MSEPEAPWYRDGLAFECTRCGACCTGAPGYVWVNTAEIARLAEHLGLVFEAFTKQAVRQVGERFSLIERPDGDCVFWDRNNGCTVYPARPDQCRTWPFWAENLATPEDWARVRRVCPGSGRGPLHGLVEIEQAVRRGPE